jgi:hypothetical protein
LEWEKVNEITWKLTNGEQTNVPASHGQWAGYRTSKAIAWVINIAPNAWLARCEDQTSNASPLNAAKSEAMAMAKGACGGMKRPGTLVMDDEPEVEDTAQTSTPGSA